MTASCGENRSSRVHLGGEKPLLDPEIERRGVEEILASLTEREAARMLDSSMPIRHFRAEKGNVHKAIDKLKAALKWREEFDVDTLVKGMTMKEGHEYKEMLIRENKTAKVFVRGYDKDGRAFLVLRPAMENTHVEADNMKHLVWNLEKAIACTKRKSKELGAKDPLEKINLIIDYEGFTLSHAPPLSTSRYTLDILQKHFPERMKHIYLLNPPLVFKAFWSLVRPFVDPATKEKIVVCSGLSGLEKLRSVVLDLSRLDPSLGGFSKTEFDSMTYLSLPFSWSFEDHSNKKPIVLVKTLGCGSFLLTPTVAY